MNNVPIFVGAAALGIGGVVGVFAADLDDVMGAGAEKVLLAQTSQKTIDDVVEQTESLEAEYKQVTKQIDGLNVYNDYMERQIVNQDEELDRLRGSIDQISTIERQIMPLMIRMLESLEQFVALDAPFLKAERTERVTRIRAVMERADVTVAEKFRRLTEAFQIENDFGRTIESYPESLEIGGAKLEVDMLRLGRVGLFYQTKDASRTGRWDSSTGEWVALSGGAARNQVRNGIRVARKQVAPDLLLLDVPGPEVMP